MNVTAEINKNITQYGGSGSSREDYLSSNKSLNFAGGSNNINSAPAQIITAIPQFLSIEDEVGLFGSENIFMQIDLKVLSSSTIFINIDYAENDYFPVWTLNDKEIVNDYQTALFDFTLDRTIVNTYEPARISNDLSQYERPVISVTVKNNKTGNQYLDNWLDYQVYDKNKRPVEYDDFYIDIKSKFYLGFHARNTKRLPVNFSVAIGIEYLEYRDLTAQQRKKLI